MAGYQVSKSKLYRDKDSGKIRVEADGSVLETEVRLYALTHLNRDVATLKDPVESQAQKVELEKEKLKEQIAKLKFSREREQGLYVPREEVDKRMVAIMTAMDQCIRQAIDLNMTDLIRKVEGDVLKANEAVFFLEEKINEALHQLSRTDQFSVQFTNLDEPEEIPMEDPTP